VSSNPPDCDLVRALHDPHLWVELPRVGSLAKTSEHSMASIAPAPTTPAPPSSRFPLIAAAAAGGLVALGLGVYGRNHTPTGDKIFTLGFSTVIEMKAWLATAAFALVAVQLYTALRMYGRVPFPRSMPHWFPALHRSTGTVAFVLTLPVAYHCLWSLGFQDTDTRVLVHSLVGCAFYGAFTTKMLALRVERAPRWAIPAIGGLLVATLTGLWFTAALWYFRHR
jgi:hypothetical protein